MTVTTTHLRWLQTRRLLRLGAVVGVVGLCGLGSGLTRGQAGPPESASAPVRIVAVRPGVESAPGIQRSSMPDPVDDPYRPQGLPKAGPAAKSGSTMVGRAWTNTKNWVNRQTGNVSQAITGSGQDSADPNLMPLSPAMQPQPPANRNAARPQSYLNQGGPAPQPANRQPFGGGPVMAGPQGTSRPPATIAGRPAYQWYGWGSTTPGQNQYAPQGRYPQGSANWMAQTGATPGAFPVPPVNPFRPAPGPEAPRYAPSTTVVQLPAATAVNPVPTIPVPAMPAAPTIPAPSQDVTAAPAPPPSVATIPTIPTVAPPPVAPAPPMTIRTIPQPVISNPAPVVPKVESTDPVWQSARPRLPQVEQSSGTTPGQGAVIQAFATDLADDQEWKTAATPMPRLLPVPPPTPTATPTDATVRTGVIPSNPAPLAIPPVPISPTPPVSPIAAEPKPQSPQIAAAMQPPAPKPQPPAVPAWQPPKPMAASQPPVQRPTPPQTTAKPTDRAEIPKDAPPPQVVTIRDSQQVLELERMIRDACVRTATVLEVNETAPMKLVVKFVAKTESAAREAAQIVSSLAVLKPYAVDFEVRITGTTR